MKKFKSILMVFLLTAGIVYADSTALYFDGSNDYVPIGNKPIFSTFTDKITISVWIKPIDTGSMYARPIISKRLRYSGNEDKAFYLIYWSYQNNDRIIFCISQGAVSTPIGSVTSDEWLYVTAVYDGNTIKIYLDSNLEGNSNCTGNIIPNTDPLEIGARSDCGSYRFYGTIDEVRIWKRALTQQEIQDRMYRELNMNNPADTTGLVGYWRFNEGIGDIAYDLSSYTNNGSLVGPPDWVDGMNLNPAGLTANFEADTTSGYVPLTVQFTDLSTPQGSIISWQWDFQNDGVIDSYVQNPSFTYYDEGVFSAKLIVQDSTQADTLVKENYITTSYGPPQNLYATPSLNDITLCWNPSYDPDILIYKIYRDTLSEPTTQIYAVVHPDTNWVDTTVDMNTTYYYRVTGYTIYGEETDYSNEVSAQLLPQMSVYPTSFEFTANMNDTTLIDSFEIDNTGGGQLVYSIVGSDTLGGVDFGTCLKFDGVDDYVDIPHNEIFNFGSGDFTVECIIKIPDNPHRTHIIVKDKPSGNGLSNMWEVSEQNTTGITSFSIRDQNNNSIFPLSDTNVYDEQFHHIAGVRQGDTAYLFIDGELEGIDQNTNCNSPDNTESIWIMANGEYNRFTDGIIEEVRIWNIALSQSEIQANMYQELTGNESGLVGYWKFNEGSGNIAYDSSPYSNDGTLINMNLSTCWVPSDIPVAGSSSILSFVPSSGILNAESKFNQMVTISVDVSDLTDGIYNTSADITHNDSTLANPYIIPVTITVDRIPPEKVTGLYYTATMDDITLFWSPSTAPDIYQYHIYRSTEPDTMTYLDSVSYVDTTYTDSNIPDEELTYYYWITAEDVHSNIGEYSDSISAYLDIPASVRNLNIVMVGSHAVLTWSPVDTTVYGNPIQNLTGYIIYFADKVYQSDTLFTYHAFTTDTTYTHEYVGVFTDRMFYRVTAYVGDLRVISYVNNNNIKFKLGELEAIVEEYRKE